MSRIGKQIIEIPKGTDVTIQDGVISVKGPKGELKRNFNDSVEVVMENNTLALKPVRNSLETLALWGTYGAHLSNMIQGVNTPFEKKLIIEGIGYRAEMQGTTLVMNLGFSHQIKLAVPESLKIAIDKGIITISGVSKDEVGGFAAKVRSYKKPEPYKGKGIRYENEIVKRKQGKKSV